MGNDLNNSDLTGEPSPVEDQLVAYLDGELDDESTSRVEQQMTADPNLRDRLTRLERTWNMLDELEQVEVGETFTRSTIEMVTVAAEEERELEEATHETRRHRRWLAGSAGLVVSAIVGFIVVSLLWPNPNRELLEDLPVLENLDQYQQIDDIKFLELLQQENLFPAEEENGA